MTPHPTPRIPIPGQMPGRCKRSAKPGLLPSPVLQPHAEITVTLNLAPIIRIVLLTPAQYSNTSYSSRPPLSISRHRRRSLTRPHHPNRRNDGSSLPPLAASFCHARAQRSSSSHQVASLPPTEARASHAYAVSAMRSSSVDADSDREMGFRPYQRAGMPPYVRPLPLPLPSGKRRAGSTAPTSCQLPADPAVAVACEVVACTVPQQQQLPEPRPIALSATPGGSGSEPPAGSANSPSQELAAVSAEDMEQLLKSAAQSIDTVYSAAAHELLNSVLLAAPAAAAAIDPLQNDAASSPHSARIQYLLEQEAAALEAAAASMQLQTFSVSIHQHCITLWIGRLRYTIPRLSDVITEQQPLCVISLPPESAPAWPTNLSTDTLQPETWEGVPVSYHSKRPDGSIAKHDMAPRNDTTCGRFYSSLAATDAPEVVHHLFCPPLIEFWQQSIQRLTPMVAPWHAAMSRQALNCDSMHRHLRQLEGGCITSSQMYVKQRLAVTAVTMSWARLLR